MSRGLSGPLRLRDHVATGLAHLLSWAQGQLRSFLWGPVVLEHFLPRGGKQRLCWAGIAMVCVCLGHRQGVGRRSESRHIGSGTGSRGRGWGDPLA